MTSANNTSETPLSGKFPEFEKLLKVTDFARQLKNFFEWLVRNKIIISNYYLFDVFPPTGESGDQIILRYLEISLSKLEAEKRAMVLNYQKISDYAQRIDSPATDASQSLQTQPDQQTVSPDSEPAEQMSISSKIVVPDAGNESAHMEMQEQISNAPPPITQQPDGASTYM
ncbi:MAG: hypothetical protein LBB66_04335 [Desulfovibrio sp.]|jgi:hypothetical protein|nr:hypothetical protein [Desulfovibrio sp.]